MNKNKRKKKCCRTIIHSLFVSSSTNQSLDPAGLEQELSISPHSCNNSQFHKLLENRFSIRRKFLFENLLNILFQYAKSQHLRPDVVCMYAKDKMEGIIRYIAGFFHQRICILSVTRESFIWENLHTEAVQNTDTLPQPTLHQSRPC